MSQNFSKRMGLVEVKKNLQIDSIDEPLSNRLWNAILDFFIFTYRNDIKIGEKISPRMQLAYEIWTVFFIKRKDTMPTNILVGVCFEAFLAYLSSWYNSAYWNQKFDFLEFLMSKLHSERAVNQLNKVLEIENSGFRVINLLIIPIYSDQEIESIAESISYSANYARHLKQALFLLSHRDSPDYRNSIKESLSAVESICKTITGDEQSTLGQALKVVKRKHMIPKSLHSAFSSLYGYSSDSGGIRHSIKDEDTEVTFDEAKFMLVSCSAFINYLKIKTNI